MDSKRLFINSRIAVCALLAFGMLILAAHPSPAANDKDAARAILGKWEDAVITVKATVKVRVAIGGNEQSKEENEVETLATVIDPSGMSVLSFSCIDPTRLYDNMLKKMKSAKDGPQVDLNCDITGITMVMPDGREIPAKMVLRDTDLDMAFVCPTDKPDKPMAALDISGDAKSDVLDNVCIIGRLDKLAGRTPCISMERIEAVITTPRKCYVAEPEMLMDRLGAPVFSLDGKVVGFSLLRISKSFDRVQKTNFMSNGLGSAMGVMPVILPVTEVAASAKQAIEARDQ